MAFSSIRKRMEPFLSFWKNSSPHRSSKLNLVLKNLEVWSHFQCLNNVQKCAWSSRKWDLLWKVWNGLDVHSELPSKISNYLFLFNFRYHQEHCSIELFCQSQLHPISCGFWLWSKKIRASPCQHWSQESL